MSLTIGREEARTRALSSTGSALPFHKLAGAISQKLGDRRPSDMSSMTSSDRSPQTETAIALHCSGADGSQWKGLAAAAGKDFDILAPGLLGAAERHRWAGEHAFSLLDEARPIVELIDNLQGNIHLVGHSYGGGVALTLALLRPWRVKSMALYEPSAFHLLKQADGEGLAMLAEIEDLAGKVDSALVNGAHEQGARAFVDYWNGDNAWDSLRTEIRERLTGWLPNASAHFRALIDDDTPLALYRRIKCPVLLMQGEQARRPSRSVVDLLRGALAASALAEVAGAGHMGPVTHADVVNGLVIRHMASAGDGGRAEHLQDAAA